MIKRKNLQIYILKKNLKKGDKINFLFPFFLALFFFLELLKLLFSLSGGSWELLKLLFSLSGGIIFRR